MGVWSTHVYGFVHVRVHVRVHACMRACVHACMREDVQPSTTIAVMLTVYA